MSPGAGTLSKAPVATSLPTVFHWELDTTLPYFVIENLSQRAPAHSPTWGEAWCSLPSKTSVTQLKPLHWSVPQFPHLQNRGTGNTADFRGTL